MAFPSTPLDIKFELALGADLTAAPGTWSWTNVTSFVRSTTPVQIARGRQDEASTADTSSLTFTADNRDGRWSPQNPVGAWYATIGLNTPVRVSVNNGAGYVVRFTGFLTQLPPRWDLSGRDRYMPVAAAGVRRRLGQGAVVKSALRRTTLAAGVAQPIAYWPCEENVTEATSVTPAIGPSMVGTAAFLPGTGIAGSAGALDLTKIPVAGLVANVTLPNSSGFQIEYTVLTDLVAGINAVRLFFGNNDFQDSVIPRADGLPRHRVLQFTPSGGDVLLTVYDDGSLTGTATLVGRTVDTNLVIMITNDALGAITPTSLALLAHVTVYDFASINLPTNRGFAARGFLGEAAHTRFTRLCAEESVTGTTSASSSVLMGAQSPQTFLNAIGECEQSDSGFQFEGLGHNLKFQAHTERFNLTAALALTYTTAGHVAPPMEPILDDQRIRNDITVNRKGGTGRRYVATTGALTPARVGTYDDRVDLSLATDVQAIENAAWRVHLGTVEGYRIPGISLNLAAGPSLINSWMATDLGFRVTVASPQTDVGPDTLDLMVEGYTETFGQKDWDITANTSPYAPNLVSVVESATEETKWRIDTLASTLGVGLTSGAVSASVATSDGNLWTTAGGDVPFWVNIDGEKIKVTAVSGAASPQTFTIVRSENGVVKAHLSAARVSLWQPAVIGL